jgi:hypothetical protein
MVDEKDQISAEKVMKSQKIRKDGLDLLDAFFSIPIKYFNLSIVATCIK